MNTISNELGGKLTEDEKQKQNIQCSTRVALPGIIQSFDPVTQTVTVQPAINEIVYNQNGLPTHLPLPVLLDVPIVIPRAGDYVITLPIRKGDECLVIFADMCIDAWWQNGGMQNQIEQRRHDLSDGFAILGTWSQPNRLSGYSTDKMKLLNVKTGTGIEISDGTVNIIGRLTVNGQVIGG